MNQHLLDAYNSTLDGDEWGNVQAWRFAIAHVLYHTDECPDEWQYGHGLCFVAGNDFKEFEESEISYMLADHLVTVQDLIEFGDMLGGIRDSLVSEGKDY